MVVPVAAGVRRARGGRAGTGGGFADRGGGGRGFFTCGGVGSGGDSTGTGTGRGGEYCCDMGAGWCHTGGADTGAAPVAAVRKEVLAGAGRRAEVGRARASNWCSGNVEAENAAPEEREAGAEGAEREFVGWRSRFSSEAGGEVTAEAGTLLQADLVSSFLMSARTGLQEGVCTDTSPLPP